MVASVNEAGMLALASELRGGSQVGRVVTCVADITDADACRLAAAHVVETLGGIDILINNAGRTHLSFLAETEAAVFRRIMDINFFGALHMTQAALPSLVGRRGAIGVLSSVAGFAPLSGRSGYSASKHALHGLFDSLRGELKDQGVSVGGF